MNADLWIVLLHVQKADLTYPNDWGDGGPHIILDYEDEGYFVSEERAHFIVREMTDLYPDETYTAVKVK